MGNHNLPKYLLSSLVLFYIPNTQLLVIWWAPNILPFLPLHGSDFIDLLTVPDYKYGRYTGCVYAKTNANDWIMLKHINP